MVKGRGELLALAGLALALSGCLKASAHSPANDPPKTPAHTDLYQTVSTTAFQLNTTVDALSGALDEVQKLREGSGRQQKEVCDSIEDLVNKAGETLGDYPVPPKGRDEVEKNPPHFQRWVAGAKTATDQTLRLVLNAESVPLDFRDKGTQANLTEKLGTAEDGLRGALSALAANGAPN